jgi:hypothetical protein
MTKKLSNNEFIVLGVQLAIFFNKSISNHDKISYLLKEKNIFEGLQHDFKPFPKQSDVDINIINSNTQTGSGYSVAYERADLYQQVTSNLTFDTYDSSSFLEKLREFISVLESTDSTIKINRLGFVVNLFYEKEDYNGSPHLLCLPTDLANDIFDSTIRFNSRKRIGNISCNNIFDISPGILLGTKKRGALLQRDINTLIEDKERYSFNDIQASKFVTDGLEEMKKTNYKSLLINSREQSNK